MLKMPRRGRRFNYLKVLGPAERSGRAQMVQCRCDCGVEKPRRLDRVLSGLIISCGCKRGGIGKRSFRWAGYAEISGTYWLSVKKNAATRNIPFEITIEWAWKLYLKQDRKCAITGLPIGFGKGQTASLDRIYNGGSKKVPYAKGQVRWTHRVVNMMKGQLTEEEFVEWCRRVAA